MKCVRNRILRLSLLSAIKTILICSSIALPALSSADIMAKVKGVTSKKLREEFPHLLHLPSLWTRSYYVSTAGNVSSETIKGYDEQQKTRG